mgnify:CR=1 FL=1|tara:strand:+ start:108 stop:2366 length:2259 start_codon:yes stop_codon:yes gene_type:complete
MDWTELYVPNYDKLHFRKIKKRHSFTPKLKRLLKQFLNQGEKVSFKDSVVSNDYCVAIINESKWKFKRLVFCKINKDKLNFLYSSKDLIEDYESNNSKFKRFKTDDPYIYLHLAEAIRSEKGANDEFIKLIKEFINRTNDQIGRKIKMEEIKKYLKVIENNAWLFYEPSIGYKYFLYSYLDLCKYNLAAIASIAYAECFFKDDNKKHLHYAKAFFLLGWYKKARIAYNRAINDKDTNYNYKELDVYIYKYLWALGMEKWEEKKNEIANEIFQTAKKLTKKDSPHEKLMDYFLKKVCFNKELPSVFYQFYLFEKYGKEAIAKSKHDEEQPDKFMLLGEDILENLRYIKENITSEKSSHKQINDDKKEKLEINFTPNKILLPNKKPLNKNVHFILFENIILNGRINWLWGFVLLSIWTQTRNKLIDDPKYQFGNYISSKVIHYLSKEKENFECYGFVAESDDDKNEWWINYKNSKVECNLLKSRNFYESAKKEFDNGDISKAIEKLNLAISPNGYETVKFINAYNLLIKCIFKVDYKDISETLLSKIKRFLIWYKIRLSETVLVIRNIYIENKILLETNVKDELTKIEKELERSKKSYKAIEKRISIDESDIEYENIVNLIHTLRKTIYDKIIIEGKIKDFIFNTEEFNEFKNNKYLKEIFIKGNKSLRKQKPNLLDIEGTVDSILLISIQRGIDFDRASDLESIINYLNKGLKKEINDFVKGGKPLREKLEAELDKVKFSTKGKRILPKSTKN